MYSLNDTPLESNKKFKINFNGGDLSSDAGLLLIKEFACKLGFSELFKKNSKPMMMPIFDSIRMTKISGR